ncbi:MAG: OmpH family outer membrane protein [Bacteroidales bacterium]|jgi:outer membrane protein|nr:OmpH family outer membrane protein [Bacteroidales bacterium]
MKKTVLTILSIVLLFSINSAKAQKNVLKFGHINTQELMTLMPERDSAQQELKDYSLMLQQEMEAMQVEYNKKVKEYMEKKETYSDLVRQSKESGLQELQRRVQEFQSTAQKDYSQKESEILQPIMKKAEDAIKRVGENNGFVYIYDISTGTIVYKSAQSIDVLPLVKKELGIQ